MRNWLNLAKLAFLILVVIGGNAVAAPASPDSVVSEWIGNLRAAGLTVTFQKFDLDQTGNAIEISGAKLAFPSGSSPQGFSVVFGSLELTRPGESATEYTCEALKGSDITISYGAVRGSVKSLVIGNGSIPKLIANVEDPRRMFTSTLAFLRNALLSSWDVLSFRDAKFSTSESANSFLSFDGIQASNVHDGLVDGVEIAGLAINEATEENQIRIEEVKLSKFVLKTLSDAFSSESSEGLKREWMTLGESVKVKSFDYRAPGRHIELSEAAMSGLWMRPLPVGVTDYFDGAAANPQFPLQHREEQRKVASLLLRAIKADRASARNFVVDDTGSAIPQQVICDQADIKDLTPLSAGSITLGNVRLQRGDFGITVGLAGASDLRFAGVEPIDDGDIDKAKKPYIGGASIDGLEIGKPGVQIKLKAFRFQSSDHVGVVPTAFDSSVFGLSIPIQLVADPDLRSFLAGLQLASLEIDADLQAHWDQASERVELNRANVNLQNVGRLLVAGAVSGVQRSAFERPEDPAYGLASAGLAQMRLRFDDEGFVTRLLNAYAKANATTPDEVRRALISKLATILEGISQAAIRNEFTFAAVGFLNDPKAVEVVATASTPVPLAVLSTAWNEAPLSIPGLLHLTAKLIRDPVQENAAGDDH